MFGLRPVIIGFLHLVFLGLVSFYILLCYIELKVFSSVVWASVAIKIFIAAVIGQEALLLIQGVGLLMGTYHSIYNWILWVISMFLFLSTFLLFLAGSNLFKKRYHLAQTSILH